MPSRTHNSLRNTGVAIAAQVLSYLLSFVTRTVFIYSLGSAYLGVNGLFTGILTLLSFTELGFGTAISYALYKPLAEGDRRQISALMSFFAKVYRIIGLTITTVGLLLIPALPFLINSSAEIPADMPPLWVVYVLYLFNSASSYFFNYKRTLVVASQNGYIDSINQLVFTILRNLLQIVILITFSSFIGYLIVQVICTIAGNISISLKADKLFPYLRSIRGERVEKETLHELKKNVLAMSFHKLGSAAVSGTDSIIISAFVGLSAAGAFSNYQLLIQTANTLFNQAFSPVTASVGNYSACHDDESLYDFFKKLLFVNGALAIVISACLAVLVNPFIDVFWGEEYVLENAVVFILAINFYLTRMRLASEMIIDTNGLFWPIKWKSLVEALLNLAVSLLLAGYFSLGILGVVIGTIVSNVCTNVWWEPYVVYRDAFRKPLRLYFLEWGKYALAFAASWIASAAVCSFFPMSFIGLIGMFFVTVFFSIAVIVVFFGRSDEFSYALGLVKRAVDQMRAGKFKESEEGRE